LHRYNFEEQDSKVRQEHQQLPVKRVIKTVTGYIFYHTSKILQKRKLDKSIFSMLFIEVQFNAVVSKSLVLNPSK